MPYDSNGNYTLPTSYFVENGDTVLPSQHNPPFEDVAQALSSVMLRSGAAPMSGDLKMGTKKIVDLASGTGTADAVNKGQLDYASVKFSTKNANYTAVASDNNTTIRFTGAYTLALDDAASLGASWSVTVIANGGDVTIDPDASETINGVATLTAPDGCERTIYCDGTAFYATIPTAWEIIRDDILSGVSTYDVTGLSAYRKLRLQGHIYPSVDAAINMLTSTSDGSSYDTGTNFYAYQYSAGTGVSSGANSANTTTLQLSLGASVDEGADDGFTFDLMVENFNKATFMKIIGTIGLLNTSASLSIASVMFRRNAATARDAFRIAPSSGTLSGYITVEGWRG